ncbi:type VI secretion system tip protein VgrG [Pseudomonas sp. 43A]|uniref:type VI secretion system Vgr family protein n=1 Tax=unclassified Pseudomonas TaxID=196821 RepID=UPI001587382F|nr:MULTISPECIES: type VI secretion system tip protein VgrG [unclassified Pseudomonas]QKV61392.1 type VI secretion system tip protein VgrG [Pseudomonas sp. 43A]QMW10129.1 type VI secretion system tip protein VgrG [Pseudomonas sp. 29A]
MFSTGSCAPFTLQIPAFRHDFKVLSFNGAEAISQLYAIRVALVSERTDVDLEALLSRPAFLQFGANQEGIHGRIENVMLAESGKRLTRYELTLVPALHYLRFSRDQRIFQNLTVPQIVAQVLQRQGIQPDDFTFNVTTSPVREYCTQYGEDDFRFIQRLCAEDGIAWHHQHSVDRHLLVFSDSQVFFPKLGATAFQPDSGMVAEHPVVNHLTMGFNTRTSTVTRRDYDLKRPSLLLESRFTAEFTPELEDYRYPLLMTSEKHGKQQARQALERHRSDYQWIEGKSNQAILRSGHLFDLTEHPRPDCNEMWLLLNITHEGKQPQVLEEAFSSDDKTADGFTQGYRNTFKAIPADVLYRPPLPAPRPVLVCQTARVTGPPGRETFCDEYGRVRVEFPWDRAELNSEKSSCWIRVASSWAGEGFGAMTIPRIGMEVVVTFQEGDPDQPLITGCVPNKVTSAAYALPANETRTVLRTQSSPRNGGYNELSIEDRAGQEKIYLRAQRDLEQLILNDSYSLITRDRFEQIGNDSTSLIEGKTLRTHQGVRSTQVNADDLLTVSGISSQSVGALVIQAGQQAHVTASNVVIDAGMSLTLSAGGHHIVINAGGIFSSVPIVEGGAPLAGIEPLQPLQAVGGIAPPVSATPLSIVNSARQQAADYCPLCEACAAGQCGLGEVA